MISTYNLLTFVWRDSLHLFLLLWSTAIPMVFANWAFNPAFCSSKRLNPLASRSTVLYLWVCPLPTGLNLWTGLGEVAMDSDKSFTSCKLSSVLLSSSLTSWLVEPGSDELIPVLSQVHVGEHIIVLDHLKWFELFKISRYLWTIIFLNSMEPPSAYEDSSSSDIEIEN